MAATGAGVGKPGAHETPAVRQYWAAKREHPDSLVFFRLGDFFELFGDDAERSAPLLGVTLTSRDFGRAGRVPMCGVPHHSLELYARKLLDAGLRVAVCDQVEAAKPGRLVQRQVVRVLSPGTLVEDGFLEAASTRRCAGLVRRPDGAALAAVDLSTGDCQLLRLAPELRDEELADELSALEVAELLFAEGEPQPSRLPPGVAAVMRPRDDFRAVGETQPAPDATPRGMQQADPLCLDALAAVLAYGRSARIEVTPAELTVSLRDSAQLMTLDAPTRANLELVESRSDGTSLLTLLDRTRSAMGLRRLRTWLLAPLTEVGAIEQRQRAVRELSADPSLRSELRSVLGSCRDLERLVCRSLHRIAGPRDLQQLARTLELLPALADRFADSQCVQLRQLAQRLVRTPPELAHLLSRALADESPIFAREPGFIRSGYDEVVDRIRANSSAARTYISELEASERQRTGIRGLKVGFNRVFGYYIEVRRAGSEQVPADYVRRQTLTGAERYVTPALKEQEAVVLGAREQALAREQECLVELMVEVGHHARVLASAGRALAELDALQSLAEVGSERGWVMPALDQSRRLELEQARHPLVEEALGHGRFVPNDLRLDGESERICLITGPNMAGKSTYLRQAAIICLLGQIGAPVPCGKARWGVVDRIFTRVGAHDELAAGRSTFMVEMAETAQILDHASDRSLLIFDEVGRGTSTYDGMSIAQAVLEYIHDTPRVAARTLFATHFHELTALATTLPAVRNFRVEVVEEGEGEAAQVTFLHRIVPGGADRSYGINVAQLAGLPPALVARAREVLRSLEESRPLASPQPPSEQLALPLAQPHPIVEELRRLEVEGLTPLQALQKLADWQQLARKL